MHHHHHGDREGAKQPQIFSHERAALLDEPTREAYMPTHALLQLLDAPHGATVLDFGAGTGRYALALAGQRPDLHVVAFDVQPEMIEIVRTRATERGLESLVASHDPSDLAPHAFDRILVVNVLHEIGDREVEYVASLLREDGVALFVDWDGGIAREVGPPNDHVHAKVDAIHRLQHHGFASVKDASSTTMPNHYALLASVT